MTDLTRVAVRPGGGDGYDVVIGRGAAQELAAVLPDSSCLLVHPVALRARAATVQAQLHADGANVTAVEVPDGEPAKTLDVAGRLYGAAADIGLDRTGMVIGYGGGSVTDLAGFVAATWMRGVRLVQVPTTLLAMVDAAVGGKAALNITAGKNLVGAFHHPDRVLCDLAQLDTLPGVEVVSGLAEVVKCGLIADPAILELMRADPTCVARRHELVERAVRVKAEIVGADPTELGRRQTLNYGHTLGHAIEAAEGYRWRHGAAISVGMVFAAEVSRLAGMLTRADVRAHRDLLASVGLPVSYRGASWATLRELMGNDKKRRGGALRLVVLERLGVPSSLDAPSDELLEQAFAAVAPR